jgi:hypothetical protein
MAHFYGTVEGTNNSQLRTVAASWAGAIIVNLFHNEPRGVDQFEVRMEQHKGNGDYRVLAKGDVGDATSITLGAPMKPLESTEHELVTLAINAGASIAEASVPDMFDLITFTPHSLREFVQQIMAHEALATPAIARQAG